MTADNRTYERLFCCACGAEVKPGTSARAVPALQPGTGGTDFSMPPDAPNPHERDEVFRDATNALPKPEELNADRYGEDLRHGFALGPDGRVFISVALEQRLKNIEVMLVALLKRSERNP